MTISRYRFLPLAFCSGALFGCGPAPTLAKEFPGAWQEPTSEVAVALGRAKTKGCGEFYQKAAAGYQGEFMVACNRMPDGSGRPAWVAYRVFIGTGDVMGPDLTAVWKLGGPPRNDPR